MTHQREDVSSLLRPAAPSFYTHLRGPVRGCYGTRVQRSLASPGQAQCSEPLNRSPHRGWKASVSLVPPSTFVMCLMLYAMVARPKSTRAPESPRIRSQGWPKMRYLMVAKGCSSLHDLP